MKAKTHRVYVRLSLDSYRVEKLNYLRGTTSLSDFCTAVAIEFVSQGLFISAGVIGGSVSSEKAESVITTSVRFPTELYMQYLKLLNVKINNVNITLSDNILLSNIIYNHIDNAQIDDTEALKTSKTKRHTNTTKDTANSSK